MFNLNTRCREDDVARYNMTKPPGRSKARWSTLWFDVTSKYVLIGKIWKIFGRPSTTLTSNECSCYVRIRADVTSTLCGCPRHNRTFGKRSYGFNIERPLDVTQRLVE